MKYIANITCLIFFVCFIFCEINAQVLLKTDFNAAVTEGSIENLISEINDGASIRLGWELDFDGDQKSDLTHWIDAEFLTVLNGHVFNQIRPIHRQIPKRDIPQVLIININTKWSAVIGTNGKMLSRFIHEESLINDIEDEKMLERVLNEMEVKESIVSTIWVKK